MKKRLSLLIFAMVLLISAVLASAYGTSIGNPDPILYETGWAKLTPYGCPGTNGACPRPSY